VKLKLLSACILIYFIPVLLVHFSELFDFPRASLSIVTLLWPNWLAAIFLFFWLFFSLSLFVCFSPSLRRLID